MTDSNDQQTRETGSTSSLGYSQAFCLIVERMAEAHGSPLPKRMVEIGDPQQRWGVRLNPTNDSIDGVERYTAHVTWNGWPAGVIDPRGGCIVTGGEADENSLCEWLESTRTE